MCVFFMLNDIEIYFWKVRDALPPKWAVNEYITTVKDMQVFELTFEWFSVTYLIQTLNF